MNLFIDGIDKGGDRMGKADDEQRIRHALAAGEEIAIAAGKRGEYRVPPGSRPVVYVLEGSARFEGDDTAAFAGDTVRFGAVPEGGEEGVIGIQAEAAFRGVLVSSPRGDPPRAAA